MTYPSLRDGEDKARQAFQVPALPESFIIDQEGRIALKIAGAVTDPEQLTDADRPDPGGVVVIRRALLIALVVLVALPAVAAALTVNEVAREVRCPTCNTPLDVSSAPVALDMKAYIAQRIEAGWTKQQIIDGLVDEFGKNVLATPPKEGFDLIAWVVPGLFVALGLLSIPIIARRWSRRSRDEVAAPPELGADDAARLDEELRRLG